MKSERGDHRVLQPRHAIGRGYEPVAAGDPQSTASSTATASHGAVPLAEDQDVGKADKAEKWRGAAAEQIAPHRDGDDQPGPGQAGNMQRARLIAEGDAGGERALGTASA